MRLAKGYKEWLNADIGCCFLKYQFEFVVDAMMCHKYMSHFISCHKELDRIFAYYNKMWPLFILCENVTILQNVFRQQNELYNNLVRLQNIVM